MRSARLTRRQSDVLRAFRAIEAENAAEGIFLPPTLGELGARLGDICKVTVLGHVQALVATGHLQEVAGRGCSRRYALAEEVAS